MNPFHDTATSDNTSRTSCFYISKSDRFYLQRLMAQRSRIDRLFRENFIPSREVKLMDNLIKTRGIYEDFPNQLLSESSICVTKKVVLKPIKFDCAMGKELEETEKSSDIFSMRNLVDKGIVLGTKKLSQCCSCCSCNARDRCCEYEKKYRRQKCTYTCGCTTSNSSYTSNDISKKNSRFETKNIKSEPCTCTSKYEELNKSKSLLKENQPVQKLSITEPSFLGFFPIDEHKIQSNSKSDHIQNGSDVLTINAEGKVIGPIAKLPQAKSHRRCLDILETLDNRKAVKLLDKDIKPRLSPKKHCNKNLQNKTEYNRSQFDLTKECLKLEKDKTKMNHSYNTNNFHQGPLKAYNVSIEAISNGDAKLSNNQKYGIVTRRCRNPSKLEKPQPFTQSRSNLLLANSTIKNNQSSIRNPECHKQSSTPPIHNPCMCTLKLKPLKCMSKKDVATQEPSLSKHSCSVRTSSEPNISSIKHLKQYSVINNRNTTVDYDKSANEIKSARAISQVKTITKVDRDLVPNLISSFDIHPNNLTKIGIDKNDQESVHTTKSVKSRSMGVHRGTYTEKLIRYHLSQVSSSTPSSRRTVLNHKLRRCLCKLKLIRNENQKTKQITIPSVVRSVSQSDPRYLHGFDTKINELLHKTESDKIYDNKCMIRSESAIKIRPLLSPKISVLESHKSEAYVGTVPPIKAKSLCDNYPFQTESGPSFGQYFDKKHSNEQSSPDHNLPFGRRDEIKIHKDKMSMNKIMRENTEQKHKFAMVKIEKEENCLLFCPAKKRCSCTLKLHKKGKKPINDHTVCVDTKKHINKDTTYINLEKNKCCTKECSSKLLIGEERKNNSTVDIPKENHRLKSLKPYLQDKSTATENKRKFRKSRVKIKTCDKTFSVTPKLKRCFCTLQFFKNNTQINKTMCTCAKGKSYLNYNVTTPEITIQNKNLLFSNANQATKAQNLANEWCHLNDNSSSKIFSVSTIEFKSKTMQSYFRKSEIKFLRLDSDAATYLSSQNFVSFESKLSFELNGLENIYLMKGNDVDSYYNSLSRRKHHDCSKCTPPGLTGLRPLLRRCYCAMNIQVANRAQMCKKKCDPEVGVPYECDPKECQKLIMKRLKKKSSKSSETNTTLKSCSSCTQIGVKAHDSSPCKQGIRLSSSYNFDIEFSKSSSPSTTQKCTSPRSCQTSDKKIKIEGTGCTKPQCHDMESQSVILKRCFCTLKLQKKGRRQQTALDICVNRGTSTPLNTRILPVAMDACQNTKPLKPKKTKMNKGTNSIRSNITHSSCTPTKRNIKTKGKHVQSQKNHGKPVTNVIKPEPAETSIESPSQGLRISSNFSFNIELFKDSSPVSTTEPQLETCSSVKSPKKSTRCVKCQYVCPKARTCDIDTQVSSNRMRSTKTGVTPFLKRCFCTLQLQKPKNVKKPVEHKAIATKTKKSRDKPTIGAVDKGTRTKKAQFEGRKLEPYECEPGVCVPGVCNPVQCAKLIKKRKIQSKQTGTKGHTCHSVSESSKSRHRKIQATHKDKTKTGQGDCVSTVGAHKQRQESTDSTSPPLQGIRIGSNFSFNIEFYKESPYSQAECPNLANHRTTKTKQKKAQSESTHCGAELRHNQAQYQLKMESKGSCVKPASCTLKLQKIGKQQTKAKKKTHISRDIGTTPIKKKPEISVAGKEVGTKTKKVTHNLDPYLCEPHECLKSIKKKQRSSGTATCRENKKKSKKTEHQKLKVAKEKKVNKRNTCLCPPPDNREGLRISSSFSFNIEFYKDNNGSPSQSPQCNQSLTSNSTKCSDVKSKGTGCSGKKCYTKSQTASATTLSKGSSMAPRLKRCYCTLALQTTNKKQTLKIATDNKTTCTNKKYVHPVRQMDLKPCDPRVCVTRKSQTTKALGKTKKLQSNAKGPCKLDKQTKAKALKAQAPQPIIADSDQTNRYVAKFSSNCSFSIEFCKQPKGHGPEKIKCERKCKEPCAVQKDPCEKQCGKRDDLFSSHSQSECPKTESKSSGAGIRLKRCTSTATLNKQHHRAVTVGRVENIGTRVPYLPQNYWVQCQTHQIITNQQNEVNLKKSICQHWQHCDPKVMKSKKLQDKVSLRKRIYKLCQSLIDPKIIKSKTKDIEIKTILPYCSGKFNKKICHSVIPNNISLDKGGTQITYLGQDLTQVIKNSKNVSKKPKLKDAKRLTVKKLESGIIDERIQTKVQKSPIKEFVCRCLHIFSKRRNKLSRDQCCAESNPKGNPVVPLTKKCLIPSKIERHSKVNDTNTSPKTTKSFKVTEISDIKKEEARKRIFSKFQVGDNGHIQNAKRINCPRWQENYIESNKVPTTLVYYSFLCNTNIKGDIPKQNLKNSDKSNSITVLHSPNLQNQSDKDLNKNKSCTCIGKCACPKLNPACGCVGHCLCMKSKEKSEIDVNKYCSKICVCASPECSIEAKKLKRGFNRQLKAKSSKLCDCACKICEAENEKSKINGELADKQNKLCEIEKLISDEKINLVTENLQKQGNKKEDAIGKKNRSLLDKKILNDVKKYKKTGDIAPITESILDIANLGFVSAGDTVRSVGKVAIDSKFTCQNIKPTVTDPSRAWTKLKSAADDGPGICTLKRGQVRLKETSVKTASETLQQQPVTHYKTDKNPKNTLLKSVSNKRFKIDFQCNPYFLSLRKKPHLAVNLCCPWFYPHCVSFLTIWRQFTDILLFLLAVAVWSPCIICMEAYRALMCCFLCTG